MGRNRILRTAKFKFCNKIIRAQEYLELQPALHQIEIGKD